MVCRSGLVAGLWPGLFGRAVGRSSSSLRAGIPLSPSQTSFPPPATYLWGQCTLECNASAPADQPQYDVILYFIALFILASRTPGPDVLFFSRSLRAISSLNKPFLAHLPPTIARARVRDHFSSSSSTFSFRSSCRCISVSNFTVTFCYRFTCLTSLTLTEFDVY